MKISFFVPGIPAPGGSKKGFIRGGKVCIVDDAKRNKPWRERVASVAMEHYRGEPLSVALELDFQFILPRPKGHFGTGKNREKLKASAPCFPTVKPDTTKLVRAAEDALKGILWSDDNLIVVQSASKHYGPKPGVMITVWTKEGG